MQRRLKIKCSKISVSFNQTGFWLKILGAAKRRGVYILIQVCNQINSILRIDIKGESNMACQALKAEK